jgi:type II secretory pathway predicted ATPase ExeA
MYETKFQLSDRPFVPSAKADAYFPSASSEAARLAISRCLTRAEGVALLIGGPGLGKSMMTRVLERDLRPQATSIVINSAGLCTRRSLLSTIAAGLELKCAPLDEGDLRMAIVDQLESKGAGNVALLVDEAHTLPLRLLEELRLLTNALHHGEPRVRIALIGNTRLEERIANSKLESFAQRVACRQYLSPLTKSETVEYIRRELFRCGADADRVFDATAAAGVFVATDGIPRLINQMCDHALVLAAAQGLETIDREAIEEAWADLQQLPAPWTESRSDAASVVEFGELPSDRGQSNAGSSQDAIHQAEASFARASNTISLLASDDLLTPEGSAASETLTRPRQSLSRTPEIELVFNASSLLSGDGFAEEVLLRDFAPARTIDQPTTMPRTGPERIESTQSRTPVSSSMLEFAGLDQEVGETSETAIAGNIAMASNQVTLSQIDVRQDCQEDPFDAIAGKLAEYESNRSVAGRVNETSGSEAQSVLYREGSRFDPATDPVYPSRNSDSSNQASLSEAHIDAPVAVAGPAECVAPRPTRFGRLFTKLLKG